MVRRGKDIKVNYDDDAGNQIPVVQRTYLEANGELLTPVTPLLQTRVLTGVPIGTKPDQLRKAVAGISSSKLSVIIPYAPGDINLTSQLKEIQNYDSGSFTVQCVDYLGESS